MRLLCCSSRKCAAQADENLFNFQLDNWKTTTTTQRQGEGVKQQVEAILLQAAQTVTVGTMKEFTASEMNINK